MKFNAAKWREMRPLAVLMVLQCLSYAQGVIYDYRRFTTVTTFHETLNTICVVPLSRKPKVSIKVDLRVVSTLSGDIISAGSVSVRPKYLLPVNSDHVLTMQHVVDDDTLHILKVILDGEELEFVQGNSYDWSKTYIFHHISLSLKGTADITPCEHQTTPAPTITTTTSTTTTIPTTTTTTPTTTIRPTETFPPEEGYKDLPPSGEEAPGDGDLVDVMRSDGYPGAGVPQGNFSHIEDYNDVDGNMSEHEEAPSSEDQEPWWKFIYIMGDYKRIPVLFLIILFFVGGLGIGSVATILCEQYCCCRNDDDDKNMEFEGGEFHRQYRTDFMRAPANSTFAGTIDATRRISKENISPPINATGSRSPGSETYSSPYASRERYMAAHSDETLPLNTRLQQDPHMTNGAFNQFDKYRDTYQ